MPRIDRVKFEDLEGLLVVDYKTGKLASENDMLAGRSLQLLLYAAAAERVLGEKCLGGAFHHVGSMGKSEQYFAAIKERAGRIKADDKFEQNRETVLEKLAELIEAMRGGRFDVLPSCDCPSYCPFKRICGHSKLRVGIKRGAGS